MFTLDKVVTQFEKVVHIETCQFHLKERVNFSGCTKATLYLIRSYSRTSRYIDKILCFIDRSQTITIKALNMLCILILMYSDQHTKDFFY